MRCLVTILAILATGCGSGGEEETFAESASELALSGAEAIGFHVLSDLDDTLKVSHSGSPAIVFNSLFRTRAFAGMSALVGSWKEARTESTFTLLSGSPKSIEGRVERFLQTNGFPVPDRIILKDELVGGDETYDYKLEALREVGGSEGEPLVLLGDDTSYDPDVYTDFRAERPEGVAAIYIHAVTGRDALKGTTRYTTAFEVAVHEMAAGRLSRAQAMKVGEVVLAARDQSVIPSFAACPADDDPLHAVSLDGELAELYTRIRDKVLVACSAR